MNTNSFKTYLLMAGLMVFFVAIGGMLGGRTGMIFAFMLALGMNFFSYWYSDKLVLKMYKAQEVSESEAPELYSIVKELTQKGNMPMPKVYIMQNPAPNAFATGRNPNNAAVAVTTGILGILNRDEIEGVLAHELAHIHGRDILIGTVAATISGAVMMMADMAKWSMIFGGGNSDEDDNPLGAVGAIAAMIIAPIAAMLIQMAISRSREYLADERGASLCGKPLALASALDKISNGVENAPMDAKPATAHMFIMNPFSARNAMKMFSTHPPVEERIAKLKAMANV